MRIERPVFVSVDLAAGLNWTGGGLRFEEKLDGVTAVREIGGGGCRAVLWGEAMRDGRFYAVDLLEYGGQDLRPLPRWESLTALDDITARCGLLRPAVGHGGEFLGAILARGGEGVVASRLDAPWGAPRWKSKRVETFDVIVTDASGGQNSVAIAYEGQDAGRVTVRGAIRDNLRPGDVIEIAAFARTVRGNFREPRFIRARPDKFNLG